MVTEIGFYSRDTTYGWLSNFHRATQRVDGIYYPTNEHFYQSQKAMDPRFQDWIRTAPNPYLAMKAGRSIRAGKIGELRPDWESVKLDVMLKGLRAKFDPNYNKLLVNLLLLTQDAYLYEDSPNDQYWGKVRGVGENNLGKLIMKVRDELRQNIVTELSK